MRNERFVSVILALLLAGLAAATLWNGYQYRESFADFKIQPSALTHFAAQLTTGWRGVLGAAMLVPLAFSLALGSLRARRIGLIVVLFCGALNWGLLLPWIALIQNLSNFDAEDASSFALSMPLLSPPVLILVGNFVVAVAFALGALRMWRVSNRF